VASFGWTSTCLKLMRWEVLERWDTLRLAWSYRCGLCGVSDTMLSQIGRRTFLLREEELSAKQ